MADIEFTHEDLKHEVEQEAETNVLLDDLVNKDGDITVDDLRTLPGADDFDDAELQKMWDEANTPSSEVSQEAQGEAAERIAEATGGEAVQTARGWKVYDAQGNEVADLTKMSATDLLNSRIGYNANGREQRKSIDEILRVAQYGHYNESKIARVEAEKLQFYKEVQQMRPQLERLVKNEQAVAYALNQMVIGNEKPLAQLLDYVKRNFGAPQQSAPQGAPTTISAAEANAEAQGQRFWYETLQPAANLIATHYNARQNEVENAIRFLIEREPAETLTLEKIQNIVNIEVPALLEQNGYTTGGRPFPGSTPQSSAPAPRNGESEVDSLKRRLAEATARAKNAETAAVRGRQRNAPPGSGRGGAPHDSGTESTVPAEAMKSIADFRKFLRS